MKRNLESFQKLRQGDETLSVATKSSPNLKFPTPANAEASTSAVTIQRWSTGSTLCANSGIVRYKNMQDAKIYIWYFKNHAKVFSLTSCPPASLDHPIFVWPPNISTKKTHPPSTSTPRPSQVMLVVLVFQNISNDTSSMELQFPQHWGH